MSSKTPRSFEKTFAELEACVAALGAGDAPLEESLQTYERGVKLSKECLSLLTEAKKRVMELREEDQKITETERK